MKGEAVLADVDQYFEENYRVSHALFCQQAHELGMPMEISPAFGIGSDGRAVHCAVAMHQPDEKSDSCLVISTGLHGVEAPFGCAVLSRCFQLWRRAGLPGCKLVLLHALNPYGFSHLRRVDDGNRDLNRNFRDWQSATDCEANSETDALYAALNPLLNPHKELPRSALSFYAKALLAIGKHGYVRVRDAVAGGQYDFPKGLFFGGAGPAPQLDWLEDRFPSWLQGVQRCVHIDLHTGLGKHATAQLFLESPLDGQDLTRLKRAIGQIGQAASLTELCVNDEQQRGQAAQKREGQKRVYAASGSFGSWMVRRRFTPEFHFAVAEFGTYSSLRVLHSLVCENAYHFALQHGASDSSTASGLVTARESLAEMFCPASAGWRSSTLDQSQRIIDGAIRFLLSSS
ncbi:MAG: M14 family metallopeptidase [Planctomycetota bacterium]